MAHQVTKLNADSHLLLDQPLLRLPHEQLRKIFKNSQRQIERDSTSLTTQLKDATTAAAKAGDVAQGANDALASLDNMINSMQGLNRKLEALHQKEKGVLEHNSKRISHLQDLYSVPSLVDESYDNWSRIRLDRLLVDSLLRSGYGNSAKLLAEEKNVEDLVDVEVFLQCAKIEASLQRGSTVECLAWCTENKNNLRKNKSNLEFDIRLQQYIELVRAGNLQEAIAYCKKHLSPHHETHLPVIQNAAALLAFTPDTQWQPYKTDGNI